MPTTYTNIAKPSATTYSNQNAIGKEQYDDTNVLYDSATVFYDGVNQALYTNINKPTATSYTNIAKP